MNTAFLADKKESLCYCYLLLFLFFFSTEIKAQEPQLQGIIIDAETKDVIVAANIFNQTSNTGTFSDDDGRFIVKVSELPATIIFSFIGYKNAFLTIDAIPESPIEIELQKSALRLPDIEVIAEPKVEKLTATVFTILDFIVDQNKILLIKNGGLMVGSFLELLDMDGDVLDSRQLKIKDKIKYMHQSCIGNIHLVGSNEVIEVAINTDKILLNSRYPVTEFEKVLKPCVEASDDFIYMKTDYVRGQFLKYDIVSKDRRAIQKSLFVSDPENIARMREEEAPFAYAENYHAISNLFVNVMDNWPPHPIVYEAWFDLFYDPIFSPLHDTGNEICLFDHSLGELRFYAYNGKQQRLIPINYHKEKKWDKTILKDKKHQRFYTVYSSNRGKKFYEINLKDGTVDPAFKIDCTFVEKLLIYDGHLFYLESGASSNEANRLLQKVKMY